MADSFTPSLLLRKPEINANQNAWGALANEDFGSDRIEQAIVGVAAYTLSGPKTLTRTNGETDEARMRVQTITGGTGGTLTIPAVPIWYWFVNNASGDATVTNGSNSVVVPAGSSTAVFSPDGNALTVGLTKQYVDNASFSAALPGQSGNGGKALTTDGTTASWNLINLTSGVTGTLPAARGGTGVTSLAALKTGLALNNVENKSSAAIRADFTAAANTYTGKQSLAPSAAGSAGLNLGQGAAPTAPVDGDIWTTSLGMFVRAGGVTQPLVSKFREIAPAQLNAAGPKVSFSDIPQDYSILILEIMVAANAGNIDNLVLQVSGDNGATWSAARTLQSSVPASTIYVGPVIFMNYSRQYSFIAQAVENITSVNAQHFQGGRTSLTTGINAIRVGFEARSFVAGNSFRLFAL